MNSRESMQRSLTRWGKPFAGDGPFHVCRLGEIQPDDRPTFSRREYYKISLLLEGESIISYADQTLAINGPAVIFSNPMIPYAWQRVSATQAGYFCLFTEKFLDDQLKRESFTGSSLFKVQGDHVFFPDKQATQRISTLFEEMLKEAEGQYPFKDDIQRNYVQLLIHEGIKMTPPINSYTRTTSAVRVTELFLELLARQVSISTAHDRVRIKTAAGFATQLSVHVNHLNKSIKTVTGKTTTQHIAELLAAEARGLLRHTNWDVAEIGYCLGFAHSANFIIFFRRMTGDTPNQYRLHR